MLEWTDFRSNQGRMSHSIARCCYVWHRGIVCSGDWVINWLWRGGAVPIYGGEETFIGPPMITFGTSLTACAVARPVTGAM